MRRGVGRGQGGYLMIEVGLALILAAVMAISTLHSRNLANQIQLADTEGDKLSTYRRALQAYTEENFIALQAGQPVIKNGITLVPGVAPGQTMKPDVASLIAMTYLRQGFVNEVLIVPGAKFDNEVTLTPAGCVATACNVDGLVWIDQPVLTADGAGVSSPLLGEMLSHLGDLAGSSDVGSPTQLSGFGGSWTYPNPVPGQPVGIIGAHITYDSAALAAFVRLNDTRDPSLRGNLSVQQNLKISGTSTLVGAVTTNGALNVVDSGSGNTCVQLGPTGVVTIACAGTLNAVTGVFTDGSGNSSTISQTGVTTTGRINGAEGLATGSGTVFDASDPNAITVVAGQQFFRGASGSLTLMTLDNGDVVAGKNVAAQRLALQAVVTPGAACTPTSGAVTGAATEYAATASGGLAVCAGGSWVALSNRASINTPCTPNGAMATDVASGGGLICKRGVYMATDTMISNIVMGTPFQVTGDGFSVPKSQVIVCDAQGTGTGAPVVYIMPQNEASLDSAFSRTADDSNPGSNSGTWTFHLKDGQGNSLTSVTAIAMPMCYY